MSENMIKTKTTKTWKQRIIEATSGRNERGAFLWYSHDHICTLVGEAEGLRVKDFYRSFGTYLLGLVKSGHLVRAVKPRHLSKKVQYDGKPEYLYRRTGKTFEREDSNRGISGKNAHTDHAGKNAVIGHEIWRLHRGLPKWYRRMMLN